MSRTLQPLDLVRLAFSGGAERRNRAYTDNTRGTGTPPLWSSIDLSRPRLGPKSESVAYVHSRGLRLDGLVTARQRFGPQTWSITHLHVPDTESDAAVDLLASVSEAVTARRGERLVLRLRDDDPLVDEVQLHGFFQCYRETLFRAKSASVPAGRRPVMREAVAADDYDLFRLYCAAIPREVRSIIAMTFDQWRASRWGPPGRIVEYVFEADGTVRAWVGIGRSWRSGQISLIVHPDAGLGLSDLLNFGLESLGERRTVYLVVPEYQELLQRVLTQMGHEPLADYSTTVKTMAVVGKEEARLPATALSA